MVQILLKRFSNILLFGKQNVDQKIIHYNTKSRDTSSRLLVSRTKSKLQFVSPTHIHFHQLPTRALQFLFKRLPVCVHCTLQATTTIQKNNCAIAGERRGQDTATEFPSLPRGFCCWSWCWSCCPVQADHSLETSSKPSSHCLVKICIHWIKRDSLQI